MIRHVLIRLLFALLGNTYTRQFNIPYLFGATTASHDARKKRWEKALAGVYKNKDFLDFLFYQSESDKENVFRGKINRDLSRGARLRTLFIVYSARQATESLRRGNSANAQEKGEREDEMKRVGKAYRETVDIST